MELLDIVDEDGNFTGKIMEKEEAHDKKLLHWEIAIFIVNSNKQILIQKRNANKRSSPNKWGLCAGHVDSGETLEDAALRELEEEVGIKVLKEDLKLLCEKAVDEKENNPHLTRYYYILCNKKENEFVIQKEELSEVKWIDINKLIEIAKEDNENYTIKSNRVYLLERLLDFLK